MTKFFARIIFSILYIFSLLPLGVHYIFSDITRFFIKNLFRYRYSVITTNIARSFPQMRYEEVKKLTNEYYRHMCDLIFESIWDLGHSAVAVRKRITVSNEEVPNSLQEKHGKILFVMGHFGNWEMISGVSVDRSVRAKNSYVSNPVYIVYKKAKNNLSNELIKLLRTRKYKKSGSVGGVLESNEVIRHALKNREQKVAYVLIADQNPTGKNDPVVTFLSQPTYMLSGPEFLAVKLKMPVVYLSMRKVARGRYHVDYKEIAEDASTLESGFVTKRFAQLLEEDIRANKVNWLWSHRRWKRNILK